MRQNQLDKLRRQFIQSYIVGIGYYNNEIQDDQRPAQREKNLDKLVEAMEWLK
jgi:hypothetical protein